MTGENELVTVADAAAPEPPDGRIGTRIIRALWLPVILTLGVALCFFAGALWIDRADGDAGRVVLMTSAGGADGEALELVGGRGGRQLESRGLTVTVYGYSRVPCPRPCRISVAT